MQLMHTRTSLLLTLFLSLSLSHTPLSQVPLPEDPPWWELFAVTRLELLTVAAALEQLYAAPRATYVEVNPERARLAEEQRAAEAEAAAAEAAAAEAAQAAEAEGEATPPRVVDAVRVSSDIATSNTGTISTWGVESCLGRVTF